MRADQLPAFASLLGIKITHYSPDRVDAELLVRPELTNRNGNLHGGAIMAFADDLGGAEVQRQRLHLLAVGSMMMAVVSLPAATTSARFMVPIDWPAVI